MIKKLTFTILLTLTASIGFAQLNKTLFEKYGVAEGLPEEFVRGIIQDDKGFIWFATQNGLVKYDGYRFKVYKKASDKADTTDLQIRNIFGLFRARDGKIWMAGGTGEGVISSFDPLSENFRNYYPTYNTTNVDDESVTSLLFEDEEGNIWFKNGSELTRKYSTYSLNPTTGEVKHYPIADINGGNRYWSNYGTLESSGTIWLLDDKKNLNRLNTQKDGFEIIIPAGKDILQSGKADTIRQLSKASANRLLLTGTHGLYIFDSKNQKIVKSYVHQPGNTNGIADSVRHAVEDFNGQYWVIHNKGILSLIDPASDKIQTLTYGSESFPYQKGIDLIQTFFIVNQNKEGILFHTWAGLEKPSFFIYYHFAEKTFSILDYNFNLARNPLPRTPAAPYLSLRDRTGLLWLGTRPGLYKQAPKKQQMDLFRFRADEPDGLPSDSIRYLFEDSKKRLWVGTANGLALYQPGQDNFKVFKNNPSNPTSISSNAITAVQEDADGKIWVGTQNGLNQFQESNGSFKRYFHSPKEINPLIFIFSDKQQRLWLSIRYKGVFVLDKNNGKVVKTFVPDAKNPASLSSKQIDVFYQDSRENIWLGDSKANQFGLFRLNEREDGFTHYLPVAGDTNSISNDRIFFITEDDKQRLWIGTNGGLNLYDYAKNNFTVLRSSNLAATILFTTDKTGEPWFGTYSSGGLVSVNIERRIISAYGESKGLLHNDLNGPENSRIAKDTFGRFWLPTQRGLSVFDPETKSFVSYFEKDGFQPYDRLYTSIATSNGDIWIGSSKGLNRIVPGNLLKKDTTLPAIVITQVTINDSLYSKPDGTVFKQSVAYTDEFELKHWQKNLSFDFVALHYLRSEDNQYSWKLENYDKDWSAPSKERKVSYTNLSPGKYIFRVKASNADGFWNEEGISMTITILPPWWLTWWAYILYALLFLAALRTFSLWRERKLRKEKEELQQKVEERTVELKTKSEQLEHSLTDLKSTQSLLIQSEKLASLGELTAGIAHEIQNPLNFVNNFSEVSAELVDEIQDIRRKTKDPAKASEEDEILEDIKQNLEKITFHGKRADAIVKGMLQHSRTNSGQKEPTDINALCDEYLRLAYHGLKAKDPSFNASFYFEPDTTLPKVNVVPQDIGRVLLNLINNAFYAVDEKKKQNMNGYAPTVSVSTKKLGDKVLISVSDNGNGIPSHVVDKIFQPFFTTKPTGQGTGLGLSLSYDIVHSHGGELKVETLPAEAAAQAGKEGEGTTFIINLPVNHA